MIKYINKEFISQRGTLASVHYVNSVRLVRSVQGTEAYVASVQSFATVAALIEGSNPADSANYRFTPDGEVLGPSLFDAVYTKMLTDSQAPYFGGTLAAVNFSEQTLENAKETKWQQIKVLRANVVNSNMNTPYGEIQCSPEDRQNITDAILLAQTLTSLQQPVSIPWTMSNNSVVILDLEKITAIGLLLGQKVQEAHAVARTLRTAIEAALTIEEVEAVTWPAP